MAELTLLTVDIRRADGSVWSWIESGWIGEPADVRGVDQVIEKRAGRVRRGRTKDRRVVMLFTQLKAATPAAMLALQQEMAAIWDGTHALGTLAAADQYRGLASGKTATLADVWVENVVEQGKPLPHRMLYSVEVHSIANPPEWVITP